MSIATSFWTWFLVIVFHSAPMTMHADTPPPPPPSNDAASDEECDAQSLPVPSPPVRSSNDRIYVGF